MSLGSGGKHRSMLPISMSDSQFIVGSTVSSQSNFGNPQNNRVQISSIQDGSGLSSGGA